MPGGLKSCWGPRVLTRNGTRLRPRNRGETNRLWFELMMAIERLAYMCLLEHAPGLPHVYDGIAQVGWGNLSLFNYIGG